MFFVPREYDRRAHLALPFSPVSRCTNNTDSNRRSEHLCSSKHSETVLSSPSQVQQTTPSSTSASRTMAMRRNTPPPPKTAAAAQSASGGGSSVASKPFASSIGSVDRSPRGRNVVASPSPRPRSTSTAKYLANKSIGASNNAGGLSAVALSQVRDQGMSMSQRIDQIMKVPKVDARPEMYRIDVGLEEDLRKLHDQQNKRDPELQANPMSRQVRGAPATNKTSYNFLDVAEVVSSVGESTGGARSDHHGSHAPRACGKKHVVPPLNTGKIVSAEKKHVPGVASAGDGAPWEQPPGARSRPEGRLASPRSNVSNQDILSASPIDGRVHRTNSGKSTGTSLYEFAPSLQQLSAHRLKSPRAARQGVSPRSNLTSPQGNEADAVPPPAITVTSSGEAAVESIAPSAAATTKRQTDSPTLRPPSPQISPRQRPNASTGVTSAMNEDGTFPATRGASATSVYKPHVRTQQSIAKFEASQPRNTLPPRHGRSASPRGVLLDFSHDSHFTSFGNADNTVSMSGVRTPRLITVGKVTSPSRPLAHRRNDSPSAVGDPNVLAPDNPPPKRLARAVTPPGGRRGSSGIFDVMSNKPPAHAFGSPKKSLANMSRLHANTRTNIDNTIRSPSLEGVSATQHAAVNEAPLRRTMSSLQTTMVKAPDSLKASVLQRREPVCRKMFVSSPHAMRLQSSTQVSVLLAWD